MRMAKLERITVTMPEEMAAKLRAAVDAGEYATTSEIVRETVRAWASERDREDADNATIRALLDKARASGVVPADEVFARVREHVAKVAAEELARRGEA
jgi:antitoxin ParD1/3/4